MANPENLKPFKKNDSETGEVDLRINREGLNKGSVSLTKSVKEFLRETAKDGETYEDKLKKAAVLRAIAGSDKLLTEIWDRMDGKPMQKVEQLSLNVNYELSEDEKGEIDRLLDTLKG